MRTKVTYFRNWDEVPLVLTLKEAAILLDMTIPVVRSYAREKTIPARKVGKEWRFNKSDIRQYLEGSVD